MIFASQWSEDMNEENEESDTDEEMDVMNSLPAEVVMQVGFQCRFS